MFQVDGWIWVSVEKEEGLGVWGSSIMDFKVSRMDEIIRAWVLIEKQPED